MEKAEKLSKAPQLVIDQMRLGWMLSLNGVIKPPRRDDQPGKMRIVHRRTIKALTDRKLITWSGGSDYWSLV